MLNGRPRRPRKVSISMVGRHCLFTSLWMTTSLKYRPSCAGRPIELQGLNSSMDPGMVAGVGFRAALLVRTLV